MRTACDYYQEGLCDADTQVKKCWSQLSLKYHPDKHPDNRSKAEEMFKQANEAFSRDLRKSTRTMASLCAGGPRRPPPPPPPRRDGHRRPPPPPPPRDSYQGRSRYEQQDSSWQERSRYGQQAKEWWDSAKESFSTYWNATENANKAKRAEAAWNTRYSA